MSNNRALCNASRRSNLSQERATTRLCAMRQGGPTFHKVGDGASSWYSRGCLDLPQERTMASCLCGNARRWPGRPSAVWAAAYRSAMWGCRGDLFQLFGFGTLALPLLRSFSGIVSHFAVIGAIGGLFTFLSSPSLTRRQGRQRGEPRNVESRRRPPRHPPARPPSRPPALPKIHVR